MTSLALIILATVLLATEGAIKSQGQVVAQSRVQSDVVQTRIKRNADTNLTENKNTSSANDYYYDSYEDYDGGNEGPPGSPKSRPRMPPPGPPGFSGPGRHAGCFWMMKPGGGSPGGGGPGGGNGAGIPGEGGYPGGEMPSENYLGRRRGRYRRRQRENQKRQRKNSSTTQTSQVA